MITIWVNPDAAGGGDGSEGAPYTSLSTAEGTLGTLTDNVTINCITDGSADAVNAAFSGYTPGSYTVLITVPSAYRHDGKWNTAKYRLLCNTARALDIQVVNTSVEWMQAKTTIDGFTHCYYLIGGAGIAARQCIAAGTTTQGEGFRLDGAATLRNCIATGCNYGVQVTFGTATIQNCVFANNRSHGCYRSAGTANATNCYSGGNTGDDWNGTWNLTTCASEDGTGGSTVAFSTSSGAYFTNVGAGTENLHIGTSSALRDAGTDLSTDFLIDIDGETRSLWSIGADDGVATLPTAVCWGDQGPHTGEDCVVWTGWKHEDGSAITVNGDASWGDALADEPILSPVADSNDDTFKRFTITPNKYGSGSGSSTISIRGSLTSFAQLDASPSWETYTAPITRTWRYVQVKVEPAG